MTEKEQTKSTKIASSSIFSLERSFRNPFTIFQANTVDKASSKEILIVVDTNVLLLPYTLGKSGVPALQDVYKKLKLEQRLFLPARAGREFIRLRDLKLGELLKNIDDLKSKLSNSESRLPPILDSVAGIEDLRAAGEALAGVKKDYIKSLGVLERTISGWNGNDPVTTMYLSIFNEENIVSPQESEEELLAEWERRLAGKIPPGYKDGNKDDLGVGDYLIWRSILLIGATHKKDMIFVTSDEKADWFVRSNHKAVYPRPELIAEYREASGGKNIRLAGLHDILREMKIENELVKEVENAEIAANHQSIKESIRLKRSLPVSEVSALTTSYGGGDLHFLGCGERFIIGVSESTVNSLYVYPSEGMIFGLLNIGNIGAPVEMIDLIKINQPFQLSKGQIAFVQKQNGATLALRLESCNAPSPTENFEITFSHIIFPPGHQVFIP